MPIEKVKTSMPILVYLKTPKEKLAFEITERGIFKLPKSCDRLEPQFPKKGQRMLKKLSKGSPIVLEPNRKLERHKKANVKRSPRVLRNCDERRGVMDSRKKKPTRKKTNNHKIRPISPSAAENIQAITEAIEMAKSLGLTLKAKQLTGADNALDSHHVLIFRDGFHWEPVAQWWSESGRLRIAGYSKPFPSLVEAVIEVAEMIGIEKRTENLSVM